jgi:hypothetical protein
VGLCLTGRWGHGGNASGERGVRVAVLSCRAERNLQAELAADRHSQLLCPVFKNSTEIKNSEASESVAFYKIRKKSTKFRKNRPKCI